MPSQRAGAFDDVLLLPELRHQNAARRPGRVCRNRRIAAVRFLDQHNNGDLGVGTLSSELPVPDPGHQVSQAAAADPHVPTEYHETLSGSIPD